VESMLGNILIFLSFLYFKICCFTKLMMILDFSGLRIIYFTCFQSFCTQLCLSNCLWQLKNMKKAIFFRKKLIFHQILYRIWPFSLIKGFWGRWLLIWSRNWKIENGESNMDGNINELKIWSLENMTIFYTKFTI